MADTIAFRRMLWLDRLHADPNVGPMAFMVAYAVGMHINKGNGLAWPGQPKLAKLCRCDVRTVRRMLGELITAGHLAVAQKPGRNRSTRYRMVFDDRTQVSAHTDENPDTGVRPSISHDRTSVSQKPDTSVHSDRTPMSTEPKRNEPKEEPNAKPGASRLGLGDARTSEAFADASPLRAPHDFPFDLNDTDAFAGIPSIHEDIP